MPRFPITSRNRVRRVPRRGQYDRETAYHIIDEALYCHVAIAERGVPSVIPTLHARRGDDLLLHGSRASRLLKHLGAGKPVSVAITLLDGIVFARSIFHHSMNYRSVVLHGRAHLLESEDEKRDALAAFADHIAPGRWSDARLPTRQELKATSVAAIPIDIAAAKIRSGPPIDEDADYALPVWAGVLPLALTPGTPIPDDHLTPATPIPSYVQRYRRVRRGGNAS